MSQGCIVHVHLQNGIVYEGILKAISPHLDIALQIAHVKNKVHVNVYYMYMYMKLMVIALHVIAFF